MVAIMLFFMLIAFIWVLNRTFKLEKKLDETIADMEDKISRLKKAPADKFEAKKEKETEKMEAPEKPPAAPRPQPVKKENEREVKDFSEQIWQERQKKYKQAASKPETKIETPEWLKNFKRFMKNADWEQFTGVKLFAWLGGIALFCGAVFFIKYSIEKNLISPAFRIALGAIAGIGLVVWSFFIDRKKYTITAHILAAGGIGLLYIVTYAATNVFHFLPGIAGFILLALVSMSCFVISLFFNGAIISALGALGAYAVPVLVSTGNANIVSLAVYLAIVNIGLFEVVLRLKSPGLFLLSSIGTVLLLTLGIRNAGFAACADAATGVAAANLLLFAVFLFRVPEKMSAGKFVKASGIVMLVGALALMAGLLSIKGPHAAILSVFAAGLGAALIYNRKEWSGVFMPFMILTFAIMFLWIFNGFNPEKYPAEFGLFLLYGAVAGLGPILLIHKHGAGGFSMNWFKVFPVAAVLMTLFVLFKSPGEPALFWPMAIGIYLICMFIYFIIGSVAGLVTILALTVINGISWITRGSPYQDFSFYLFFLMAGIILCAAAFIMYRYIPGMLSSSNLKAFRQQFDPFDEKTAEWMAATPPIGAFVLLGAIFLSQPSIQPHPGMATGVLFLAVVVFLGKRIKSAPLIMISLLAFALAQSCWMIKAAPGNGGAVSMAAWSGVLWLGSVAASFFAFRPAGRNPREWQAWAVFELIQSLFLIRASAMLVRQEYAGFVAAALFIIKLPVIIYLLRQLDGDKERNAVLAFQGGVFLFYFSCVPVIAMQREWLGLALIFESTALLWLNRRIEHPGLPFISVLLSAAGLFMVTGHLNELEVSGSMPILNAAVLSLALATASLGWSAKLAPRQDSKKVKIPYDSYFQWVAIGTGFFLANYMVADWFGTQEAAGRFNFHFLAVENFMQFACYSLLWMVFGAVLWRARLLSKWLRAAGFLILTIGWFRVILWPYFFNHLLIMENPVFNPGLLVFIPAVALFAYLAAKQEQDEWKWNVKNIFTGMFIITCLAALSQESAALLQPHVKYGFFINQNMPMSFASGFCWFIYGAGLILWPGKLERPFRIFGILLVVAGLMKTALLPYEYRDAFGRLPDIFNIPNVLYLVYISMLVLMALMEHGDKWPLDKPVTSRRFWGWVLGLFAFYAVNVEIVKVFGESGASFTMSTAGRFSQQLAYSFSWLIYAMLMLGAGILWKASRARWAALALFTVTSFKIFFMDLWRLGSLYRVASFIGLAVVLILVSFLYQKFLAKGKSK